MGRYYSGDIEGKFWFAIQSSDAADRFGVQGSEPNYISYWFTESDLASIQEELEVIEANLGEFLPKLNEFFDTHNGYNDEMLMEFLGINLEQVRYLLREYADYELGLKIRKCIAETGSCSFEAEL
jgi:hypothetical protein